MKKRILIALAIIGIGSVTIVGVALFNLQSLVDSLKPRLEAEASARLGRPLHIGSLSVGLASQVRLIANGVRVSDHDASGIGADIGEEDEGELPSMQKMEMAVRLLPLLTKKVEITSLTLTKPEITIEKTAAGMAIKGLSTKTGSGALHEQEYHTKPNPPGAFATAKSLKPPSDPNSTGLPLVVAIEDLQIEDGRIRYRDLNQKLAVDATAVNLATAVAIDGKEIRLAQTRLDALTSLARNSAAPVTREISLQIGESMLVASPLQMDAKKLQFSAFGIAIEGDLAIHSNKITANLSEIGVKLADLESLSPLLGEQLQISSPQGGISGRSELIIDLEEVKGAKIKRAHGSFEFSEVGAELPFGTITHFTAPLQYTITDGEGYIRVGSLSGQASSPILAGLKSSSEPLTTDISMAEATLKVESPDKTSIPTQLQAQNILITSALGSLNSPSLKYDVRSDTLEFRLNSDGLALSQLEKVFSLPSADLGQYHLEGELGFDLAVDVINLRTGKPGGTGSAPNTPSMSLQLNGQVIPKQLGAAVRGHKIKNVGGSPIHLSSNADSLRAKVERLSADLNGESLNLTGEVQLRDRSLTIDPLSLTAFGGDSKISLQYDLQRGETDARITGNSLVLAQVLQGANVAKGSHVAGTLTSLSSNCRLSSAEPLATISGPLSVTVENTSLKGFNLIREILAKLDELPLVNSSLLTKLPDSLATAVKEDQTTIQRASLISDIKSGLVQIKDLDLTSELFGLEGTGTYLLSSGKLELQTTVTLSPTLSDELVSKVKELSALRNAGGSLVIPVRLHGVPPRLVPIPDLAKILHGASGEIVKEKATKAIDKLLKKGGLDRLFGN